MKKNLKEKNGQFSKIYRKIKSPNFFLQPSKKKILYGEISVDVLNILYIPIVCRRMALNIT